MEVDDRMDLIRQYYALYQELGTLKAVAKKVGVSDARVAQRLRHGAMLGLFTYGKRDKSATGMSGQSTAMANELGVPTVHQLESLRNQNNALMAENESWRKASKAMADQLTEVMKRSENNGKVTENL